VSTRRLVITSVMVGGLSQSEAARRYGVTEGWVSRVLARYRAEGEAAFEPRSRRPLRSPSPTGPATVDLVLVLALRKDFTGKDVDAGPPPSPGTGATGHRRTRTPTPAGP